MTLLKEIADARHDAFKEAKVSFPWVWSRGANIGTVDRRGDQCDPYPAAECYRWDGTMRSIRAAIDKVEKDHPDVVEVYIEGGYDGGDRSSDKKDGNYEPWVSSWSVVVWKREGEK